MTHCVLLLHTVSKKKSWSYSVGLQEGEKQNHQYFLDWKGPFNLIEKYSCILVGENMMRILKKFSQNLNIAIMFSKYYFLHIYENLGRQIMWIITRTDIFWNSSFFLSQINKISLSFFPFFYRTMDQEVDWI